MSHWSDNLIWLFGKIIKDIFRLSLAVLIIFFALETFEPGLVSNHLDFNILLVFCLAFGILTALWREPVAAKVRGAYFWGFIFGLIVMLAIGWQTYDLDWFGYFLPLLAGLIVVLIFWAMRGD